MADKPGLIVLVNHNLKGPIDDILNPFKEEYNIIFIGRSGEIGNVDQLSGSLIIAEEGLLNPSLFIALTENRMSLLCVIIPRFETSAATYLIEKGAFDVVTLETLDHLPLVMAKANREMNRESLMKGLSLETELFSRMVDNSRSMFTVIDNDYRYIKVNDLFCKAHQVEGESIVGKKLHEVWGAERFNKYIRPNVETCFAGNTIVYHSLFDIPSGGNRHFEVVMRPVKQEGEQITHILCETFDITEITLASQAASNLKSDFLNFETHLPIGYLRTSLSGNIIHGNKSLGEILGFDNPEDMTGLPLKSFYTDPELFDLHAERLLDEGVISYGKFNLRRKDGKEIVCRISGFLAKGEHIEGTVSFDFSVEDITREIELESRLNQAEKMETIGSLAGGIAHDFNNILGTIFGYSELMLEELPEGDNSRSHIEKILTAISRARSLINQMLAFSRQSGQERVPVNAASVLEETIEFVKVAKDCDTTITFNSPAESVIVHADPTQLFRVFINILVNALQAGNNNDRNRVEVSLEKIDEKELPASSMTKRITPGYARITITDSGCGIEDHVIGHIFEPFYTTKSTGKGTGLGLSVVHGIILELGGDIGVKSRPGEGTTFHIYLPEFSGIDVADSKPEKSYNILLLTGQSPEGSILKMALENLGHKPLIINNALKVREAADSNRAEVLIYMDDNNWDERSDVITELKSGWFLSLPLIVIAEGEYLIAEENLLNLNERCQHLLKPVSLREVNIALKNCFSTV